MGNEIYINAVIGLCFVVGLIFICAFLARKYGINANVGGANNPIKLIASRNLDIKNKLVVFQNNDIEYLVLLSQTKAEVLNKKHLNGYKPNSQNKHHKPHKRNPV